MKILLVAEREALRSAIERHFSLLFVQVVQYINPIKAMDNIDEVDPDIVMFSSTDFPRHWKTFLSFMRHQRSNSDTIFVLLSALPNDDEVKKQAIHLQANAVVSESLDNPDEISMLNEIFFRYRKAPDSRSHERYQVSSREEANLFVSNPVNHAILSGLVLDLSLKGLLFQPSSMHLASGLAEGTLLDLATLRIGSSILEVELIVRRISSGNIGMEFRNLIPETAEAIEHFLRQNKKNT